MDRAVESPREGAHRAAASEPVSGPSTPAELIDRSPRGAEMRALRDLMHHGPAAVAQRQRLTAMFGPAIQPGGADHSRRGRAPASNGDLRDRVGSDSDVAQLKLHVIGEEHDESGAQRENEKKFCQEQYGEHYYLEYEYNMPNKNFPADPSATRHVHSTLWSFDYIRYLLGSIDYIIDDINDKSDDLKSDKSTAIEEANVAIKDLIEGKNDFDDLEELGDDRDEFKEDATLSILIYRNSDTLISLLSECIEIINNATHDKKHTNELNDIARKIDTLTTPLTTALTKSSAPKSLKDADAEKAVDDAESDSVRRRSEGMAIALIKTDDSVNGAWKVGETHLDQISEYIDDEKSRKYLGNRSGADFADQLISREKFNGELRKWIAKRSSSKGE